MSGIYDFEVKTIEGKTTSLKSYSGKVLLLVNVASACGLTPQYKGLQEIYKEFQGRGLEVLGFPCNQFGGQEPGTEAEIQEFCSLNFAVSFPLFAKIEVNGTGTHPLYKYLKDQKSNKDGKADIEWNFAKFLINRQGLVVDRFHARTEVSEFKTRVIEVLG